MSPSVGTSPTAAVRDTRQVSSCLASAGLVIDGLDQMVNCLECTQEFRNLHKHQKWRVV